MLNERGGVEIYRTIRAHPDTLGSHHCSCKPLLHKAPRAVPSLDCTRVRRDLAQEKENSFSIGAVPTSTVAYLFWLVVQATDCPSTFRCSLSPVGAELL